MVPPFVYFAVIALIWGMRQIAKMPLSKHEKVGPFVNYASGLAMLITLALALGQIFGAIAEYAGLAISAVFAALIIWAYLPKRITGRKTSSMDRLIKHYSIGAVFLLVTSCILEGLSVYFLFRVGYLWGSYDMLIGIAKDFGVRLSPSGSLADLYRSVVMSLFGIAQGALGFGLVGHSWGIIGMAKLRLK